MLDALLTQSAVLTALYAIAAAFGLPWLVLQVWADRARGASPPADASAVSRWWWLRWSAMVAFLAAWGILAVRGMPFRAPTTTLLTSAVFIACLQWFNVWFVAWPAMTIGGEQARRRAAAVLRLNVTTAIPMVFFIVASSWAQGLGGGGRWVPNTYWMLTGAVHGALELAALLLPRATLAVLRPWPIAIALGAALAFTVKWVR